MESNIKKSILFYRPIPVVNFVWNQKKKKRKKTRTLTPSTMTQIELNPP